MILSLDKFKNMPFRFTWSQESTQHLNITWMSMLHNGVTLTSRGMMTKTTRLNIKVRKYSYLSTAKILVSYLHIGNKVHSS